MGTGEEEGGIKNRSPLLDPGVRGTEGCGDAARCVTPGVCRRAGGANVT